MTHEAKHPLDTTSTRPANELFTSVYKGPANFFKLNKLEEATSYAFRISATNETGQGTWSDILKFKTDRSPPVITKSIYFFLYLKV